MELAEDAVGYIAADLPWDSHIDVKKVVLKAGAQPRAHLVTAYRVFELEEKSPGIRSRETRGTIANLDGPENSEYFSAFLRIQLLYALLGRITKNLAEVGYEWDASGRSLALFFCYGDQVTALEKTLSNQVLSDVSNHLPKGIQVKIERHVGLPAPSYGGGEAGYTVMAKCQG